MDDYERDYMQGEGKVLHRQKATLPRWVIGIPTLPGFAAMIVGLVLLATGVLTVLPALAVVGGGALFAALLASIMVLTGVTRVTVSEGALDLQMGLGGMRIPIAEIDGISVGPSGARNHGIGKRILLDGTRVYSMLGDNARSVRVERAGQPTIAIVCKEPDALVAAVNDAKVRAPRVRVATDDEGEPVEVEAKAPAAKRERER